MKIHNDDVAYSILELFFILAHALSAKIYIVVESS